MKHSHTYLAYLAAIFLCLSAQSYAQDTPAPARPVLPPGPLIQKRAPDMAQWLITTKVTPAQTDASLVDPAKAKTVKGPAKAVLVTKTGNIMNTAIVGQEGHAWSVWNEGTLHLVVSPDGKQVGQAARPLDPDAVNPYFIDYSQTDFPGFEWLTADSLQDIKTYQGTQCLIFSKPGHLAYIEQDNRLPMVLVDGEGAHLYQFRTPPAAMLKLPDNVQQFLIDEQQREDSLANKKITPF